MKKTILLILVVILTMSVLVACGPNYSDELDAISQDMQTATDEWMDFMTQYSQDASGDSDCR